MSQQTLVIELNEFNQDLLKQAAESFNLKNITRILSFNQGQTLADQQEEHQGLDPWVQWVSVHTEQPSQEHGIIRLGDVTKLNASQIWERLGRQGYTTGVWGVMNASKNNCENNCFFVADPWTFSEVASPTKLNRFLALPVYFAKNYLDLSTWQMIKNAFITGCFLLSTIKLTTLMSDLYFLVTNLFKTRKLGTSFLFCAYELFATRVFAKYRKKYQPQINFIFINSIAHFQHHDWHTTEVMDANSEFVFRAIDRMLAIILPATDVKDQVLVLSALSQENVAKEGFYCYRQKNPLSFLKRIGVDFNSVEQCMTNDAHVFFSNQQQRDYAASLLTSATVEGRPAFFVERDAENPLKLFYQMAIWDKLDESVQLQLGDKQIPFFSEFAIYAQRTGAHVPTGYYLAKGIAFPPIVNNSDVFSYIWAR